MRIALKTGIWDRPATETLPSIATFYTAIATMFGVYGALFDQPSHLLHWLIAVLFWFLIFFSNKLYKKERGITDADDES